MFDYLMVDTYMVYVTLVVLSVSFLTLCLRVNSNNIPNIEIHIHNLELNVANGNAGNSTKESKNFKTRIMRLLSVCKQLKHSSNANAMNAVNAMNTMNTMNAIKLLPLPQPLQITEE